MNWSLKPANKRSTTTHNKKHIDFFLKYTQFEKTFTIFTDCKNRRAFLAEENKLIKVPSSHSEGFYWIAVLKNFVKLPGKHWKRVLFMVKLLALTIKKFLYSYFAVNFARFFKTALLKNTEWRLQHSLFTTVIKWYEDSKWFIISLACWLSKHKLFGSYYQLTL